MGIFGAAHGGEGGGGGGGGGGGESQKAPPFLKSVTHTIQS